MLSSKPDLIKSIHLRLGGGYFGLDVIINASCNWIESIQLGAFCLVGLVANDELLQPTISEYRKGGRT